MRIALAQFNSGSDPLKNLKALETFVRRAARTKAQLVLTPENTLYMGPAEHLSSVAKLLQTQRVFGSLARSCRACNIALLLGSYPEPAGGGKVFNTSLWISASGRILARYRKIHLFNVRTPRGDVYSESRFVRAGKHLVVVPFQRVQFGLSVCYDVRFPEHYRALRQLGAACLTVPAAFTAETGKDHWHTLLRARAIENLAYVLAPAQTGRHPEGRRTYGHSLAIDPWGKFMVDAGTRPGLRFAEIDPRFVTKLRQQFGPGRLAAHRGGRYNRSLTYAL